MKSGVGAPGQQEGRLHATVQGPRLLLPWNFTTSLPFIFFCTRPTNMIAMMWNWLTSPPCTFYQQWQSRGNTWMQREPGMYSQAGYPLLGASSTWQKGKLCEIHIQGGAKVGLKLWVCKTQFILVLLIIVLFSILLQNRQGGSQYTIMERTPLSLWGSPPYLLGPPCPLPEERRLLMPETGEKERNYLFKSYTDLE